MMKEESHEHLPGVISSISVQKKNKDRYSIFVDEEFLIGVSDQTLLKFNLAKGDTITHALLRKLEREEGRFEVKAYMMKRLGSRDHSRKELFIKAIRKEYPKKIIENVLDELTEKGYLDEQRFVENFVKDKSHLNKWGPNKIKAHLYKKGISNSMAEQSIQKVFADKNIEELLLHLVLKGKRRFLREEDPYKRKKKVVDHLARKGYRSSDIYKHIDDLMKALEQ